ncbi:NmrA family NAD(P)-binding protein [Myroides profundi]|uniref:Uncharacterized conserved protein YbjT, contains NAD(P)-binding and DUF2867 domains n=1 Tax=Myroides profundi TaxID=480520 RepID=A0AAJ5BCV5_MYRPR|nr:NmrA family NAD(P)-binding protein [Myroides profundi]AJH14832.1 NmrA family protein [Myroides profundi]SEQ24206.1 Uncharacterized conserved protein YbjT, contains NAD(P)-binding and DUF2867 domains [Myroides profundi]
MIEKNKDKVLIIGATGQVGSRIINTLLANKANVNIVAAIRSEQQKESFESRQIDTVFIDLDDPSTHLNALEGIDTLFLLTGYTVNMLKQSKTILDNAKKAGVRNVVHLGACGRDDTAVGHWAWHQMVERYIEWHGFTFTHLRPEAFMQNILSYGGKSTAEKGILNAYLADARQSWVDVDDIALVAAKVIESPAKHAGQTYRLGYDAKNYAEIAELITNIVGKPYEYIALPPVDFLQDMINAGAEMSYMTCVYEHWKLYADGLIPGADDVFDNFYAITGKQPTKWPEFIAKHKEQLSY